MGSIIRRGNYQYQAKVSRFRNGQRFFYETRTFETKEEAKAWVTEVESKLNSGTYVSRRETESTTLEEALDRYKQEISSLKKGRYQEERRIEFLKKHNLSKNVLAAIRSSDISDFRNERLRSGLSTASVRLELALLSHLFNTAIKEWGIGGLDNPVLKIKLPKGSKKRSRRLSTEEEAFLLESCDKYGGDIPYVVRLALATGMRRGELASLAWDNIDFKKRMATLPETKNGERRIVPLSAEAIHVLKNLPRRFDRTVFGFVDSHSITTAFIRRLSKARTTYKQPRPEGRSFSLTRLAAG